MNLSLAVLSRARVLDLLIGLTAVVLCEIGRHVYRPFIYSRRLWDFHFADTLGNSLGTTATAFVLVGIFGRGGPHNQFVLRCTIIGVVLFELASPLLGKAVDPWDLVATLLFGWLTLRLYDLVHGPPQAAGTLLQE